MDMLVNGGTSGGQSRDNVVEEQPQGKGGISMDVSVNKRASGGQSRDNEGEEQPQGTGQAGPSSQGKDMKKPKPEPETKPKQKPKPKQKTGYKQDGVWFEKVSSKLFKQVIVIDLEAKCNWQYEVTYVERLLDLSTDTHEQAVAELNMRPQPSVYQDLGHEDYLAMTV
ncbi:hypothetical protein DXG01_007206 [Tephrocybe rancida]|nr:hypothetical protein DXG01_007206 [Tephrocybe rancida]